MIRWIRASALTAVAAGIVCLAQSAALTQPPGSKKVAATFADSPPPLGKTIEVETRSGVVKKVKEGPRGFVYGYAFILPVEQGEKYKFEVTPASAADLKVLIRVFGSNDMLIHATEGADKVNWEMPRGAAGTSIKVVVAAEAEAKVNLRVSKVGDPAAGGGGTATATTGGSGDIARMKADIDALKAQNAELKKDLDEIKKLLRDLKKP